MPRNEFLPPSHEAWEITTYFFPEKQSHETEKKTTLQEET